MGIIRIESMLPSAFRSVDFGCIVERVVGPIHNGVLAEHGGHLNCCAILCVPAMMFCCFGCAQKVSGGF